MDIYHKLMKRVLFRTPELQSEYILELETKEVRIHGLCKTLNLKRGYADIKHLYPQDSFRLKRDFTFAIIKSSFILIASLGLMAWVVLNATRDFTTINTDFSQLSLNFIILALVVITLNVLDSVTTSLCFRQYPDKELKGEANPFMRKLMLKNRVLAEVVKHGGVLGIVVYFLMANDIFSLRFIAIALCLVVINNSSILISRAVTKRKVTSPTEKFRKLFHIPEKCIYFVIMAILIGLSYGINILIW